MNIETFWNVQKRLQTNKTNRHRPESKLQILRHIWHEKKPYFYGFEAKRWVDSLKYSYCIKQLWLRYWLSSQIAEKWLKVTLYNLKQCQNKACAFTNQIWKLCIFNIELTCKMIFKIEYWILNIKYKKFQYECCSW